MKRLFFIEARKLLPYKSFWFFTGGYTILFLIVVFIISKLTLSIQGNSFLTSNMKILMFPIVWQTICWIGGWFYYILGLLVILIVTNEFEYITFRQNVINGIGRGQMVAAKFLVIGALSIYACLIIVILCIVFGKHPDDGSGAFFINSGTFLSAFFLQGIGYLSFAMLIAVLFKRAVVSTGIFIIWPLIAEPVLGWLLNYQFQQDISKYLPFNVISSIISQPFSIGNVHVTLPEGPIIYGSAAYIAAMILMTWLKVKLSDL